MKDFKQTPKMNAEGSHYCGGGKVKKMAEGGSSGDMDWSKAKPVEMPGSRGDGGTNIPGFGKAKPVSMPEGRGGDGINIPGLGKVKPVPMPSDGRSQLLKTGGKVKRGNKK